METSRRCVQVSARITSCNIEISGAFEPRRHARQIVKGICGSLEYAPGYKFANHEKCWSATWLPLLQPTPGCGVAGIAWWKCSTNDNRSRRGRGNIQSVRCWCGKRGAVCRDHDGERRALHRHTRHR